MKCYPYLLKKPLFIFTILMVLLSILVSERDLNLYVDKKLVFDSHISLLMTKLYSLARCLFRTFKSRSQTRAYSMPIFI